MRSVFFWLLISLFVSSSFLVNANNLSISNVILKDQNVDSNFVYIKFDISWENSWRTDNLNGDGVTNWDAVWLFIKYKKASDGNWYHAKLDAGNFSKGSQGSNATLDIRSDSVGAFYYRSGNGTGTFSSTNVKLRWNYGLAGLSDTLTNAISEYKVFGIEMVYVPQGSFYVGDGISESCNRFYKYNGNDQNTPYLINSESSISVGNTNNYLYYDAHQYSGDGQGPIPNSFPKGYNSFYCAKNEITQQQYVDFLNTLTRAQQINRVATNVSGTSVTNRFVMSNTSSVTNRNGIRCDATLPSSPTPIVFYCDFNSNGTKNENDDGQNIICNYLSWADGISYADWAGLRPMTELEFEKAARGTKSPVANEYVWGSSPISQANAVSNSGKNNESVTSGNCNYMTTSNPNNGPIRAGIYSGNTRQALGASYYGVLELGGSLWEMVVTVGHTNGRIFTGNNGDGKLDSTGSANTVNWPGNNAEGIGFRGGSWGTPINTYHRYLNTSSRYNAATVESSRRAYDSVRLVR